MYGKRFEFVLGIYTFYLINTGIITKNFDLYSFYMDMKLLKRCKSSRFKNI